MLFMVFVTTWLAFNLAKIAYVFTTLLFFCLGEKE